MSEATRNAAGKIATIWPQGTEDKFGRKAYGAPFLISCTFDANDGSSFANGKGVEFKPSFVVWSEFDGTYSQPSEGDFIALGDHINLAAPTGAQRALPIKGSELSDCSMLDDYDDIRILA